MPSFIRHPKDFWTGFMFLSFGLSVHIIGRDYMMGTAGKMGPGYFPFVLSIVLSLIGLAGIVRSFFVQGDAVGKFYLRELFLILSAVVLFGFLIRGAGLVPACGVLIVLSAFASPKFHWRSAILLAVGLSVFSVLVFVKLLGLPMPIFGPWFGF